MPQAEPGEEALGARSLARARGCGRGEMKGPWHPNTSSAAYRRPEVFLKRVIIVEGLSKFLEMTRDWMALEDNEEEAGDVVFLVLPGHSADVPDITKTTTLNVRRRPT